MGCLLAIKNFVSFLLLCFVMSSAIAFCALSLSRLGSHPQEALQPQETSSLWELADHLLRQMQECLSVCLRDTSDSNCDQEPRAPDATGGWPDAELSEAF